MVTETATCQRCGIPIEPDEPVCVACWDKEIDENREYKDYIATQMRAWRLAHKDEIAEYARAYYLANKSRISERQAAYRRTNKIKRAEQQKAYYLANKVRIKEQRRRKRMMT